MSPLTGLGTRLRLRLPGGGRDLPARTAILLTNPRSGSTWLLDVLRAHPRIRMIPRATVFRALRMDGRRYPLDLSGGPDADRRIEVRPGQWEAIPSFDAGIAVPGLAALPLCGVEKCHPHFFDHRVERFAGDLELLGRATRVRMVYQVRDPRSSIVSFLRYQQRNPAWNAERAPVEVVAHMRRIFQSLREVAVRLPGVIVDYRDLKKDLPGVVAQLLGFLWEEEDLGGQAGHRELLDSIAEITRREVRETGRGSFLGGAESRVDAEAEALFRHCAPDLEAADEAYQRLLDLPGRIEAQGGEGV